MIKGVIAKNLINMKMNAAGPPRLVLILKDIHMIKDVIVKN